jgi:hypothetical protein
LYVPGDYIRKELLVLTCYNMVRSCFLVLIHCFNYVLLNVPCFSREVYANKMYFFVAYFKRRVIVFAFCQLYCCLSCAVELKNSIMH